jgi:hypothetical protein
MRFIFHVLFVSLLSLGLGLGLTWWAANTQHPFGSLRLGAWLALPAVGTPAIDAYTLANVARQGELPLSVVDGLAFKAFADSAGKTLDSRCVYRIEGAFPSARFWTLALYDEDGFTAANAAHRTVFTSTEALRVDNSGFRIMVSRDVQPGDWLPSAATAAFVLVLRLYDVPVGALTARNTNLVLPSITRESCS